MSLDKRNIQSRPVVIDKCQRIRQGWTESERKVRELRANLAQSRLALSILFREFQAGGFR
jgi:hypothetical protein